VPRQFSSPPHDLVLWLEFQCLTTTVASLSRRAVWAFSDEGVETRPLPLILGQTELTVFATTWVINPDRAVPVLSASWSIVPDNPVHCALLPTGARFGPARPACRRSRRASAGRSRPRPSRTVDDRVQHGPSRPRRSGSPCMGLEPMSCCRDSSTRGEVGLPVQSYPTSGRSRTNCQCWCSYSAPLWGLFHTKLLYPLKLNLSNKKKRPAPEGRTMNMWVDRSLRVHDQASDNCHQAQDSDHANRLPVGA